MMTTQFLDRVREVCREVAGRSQYVRVDEEKIAPYAEAIAQEGLRTPPFDAQCHYVGHGHATAAYVLTLATINFGSGYFPLLRKSKKGVSGYFTVAFQLKKRFEKRGPLSVDELIRYDADDCAKLFGQDRHNEAQRELMKQFALSLNELGRHLLQRYESSFANLIEAGEGSAEKLAETIATMSRFDDVAFYRDLDVPFYKRAQLAVADLWLAFGGEGPGQMDGLDQLTAFADNQVPHVLRTDGILRYDSALAEFIDARNFLSAQSSYEVEIRACTVHAVELLVAALRGAGHEANAMRVDYFLWNRGLEPAYLSLPGHRTRTIFY